MSLQVQEEAGVEQRPALGRRVEPPRHVPGDLARKDPLHRLVITAVGMVDEIAIMVAAVVLAMGFMLAFAGRIGSFVNRHPTVKMLALAFLLLIG